MRTAWGNVWKWLFLCIADSLVSFAILPKIYNTILYNVFLFCFYLYFFNCIFWTVEQFKFTCIPITAYMKNSITIKSATYGRAWNDLTNVHNNVLIPSPRLNNFTRRITRNSRKKLMESFLSFFLGIMVTFWG